MQIEDRQQRLKLRKALLDAFPSRARLEDLVDFGLNVKLNTILKKADGNLQDNVSDVLEWAHEQGRVAELLVKARASESGNPTNPLLEKAVKAIYLASVPQPLPEPPITDSWRADPLACCIVGSGELLGRIPQESPDYADLIGLWYWARELQMHVRHGPTQQWRSEVEIITARLTDLCGSLDMTWIEFLAGTRNPARKFTDDQLNNFSHPIATCLDVFNAAETEKDLFEALDLLLNNTVKYLTAIALSQYWQDRPDKAQLRTWLGSLSQAQLRTSLTVLDQICDHYLRVSDETSLVAILFKPYTSRVDDQSAIAKAYRFIRDLPYQQQIEIAHVTPQAFLGLLLMYRQESWEFKPGQFEPGLRKRLFPILRDALDHLLDLFQSLLRYSLYSIEDLYQDGTDWVARLVTFPGASGNARLVDGQYRQSNRAKPTLQRYRLYLCSPDRTYWLQLDPFLRTFAYNKLYFLEQKAQVGEIWYACCTPPARINLPEKALTLLRESLFEHTEDDVVEQFERVNAELEQEDHASRSLTIPMDILLNVYLSDEGRQTLAIALGEALRIGLFWLGVEFLFMGLSKQPGSVFVRLLQKIDLDPAELRGALRGMVEVVNKHWRRIEDVEDLGNKAFTNLREADPLSFAASFDPTGPHQPVITPRMVTILRDGVQIAFESAQDNNQSNPRVGHRHLLLAVLKHQQCLAVNLVLSIVRQAGWNPKEMFAWIQQEITPNDPLAPDAMPDGTKPSPVRHRPEDRTVPLPGIGGHDRSLLARLGRDLSALAQAGNLRPAFGESARKAMAQIGLVLQQTQENNPLLLGDPGVGKTAIVEGFAYRLATDPKVTDRLAGKRIVELPLAALMAGTKYRGDLEERIQQLLKEVRSANGQIIVFIDEIHAILGGKSEGGLAAIADALKPALARGEFPCIGATTEAEYRRYIESDPALARRFTPMRIEEPTIEEAIVIVTEVAQNHLAPRHGVLYPEAVVREAVNLAVRYIHDEFLPGKAIKLLDQAGPRMAMGGAGRVPTLSGIPEEDQQTVTGPVSIEMVREIVAERIGIPLARLGEDEKQRLLQLEQILRQRVRGQDEAIVHVARVVKRARAGLANTRRPIGVFLFAGPTGVGKTELALTLAEALFNQEDAILRLDMSEFMEKHQVSRLIGSPPGYVGYEEEAQLTGRLRRHPYSVVLLDEIEKAHRDVQHLFLQLFDNGRLTDSRGKVADGRNAIFIMTTNLGAKEAIGFADTPITYQQKLQAAIEAHFTSEFVNRIDRVVYFNPLSEEILLEIFDKLLERVAARFREQKIEIVVPESLKRHLCGKYTNVSYGARFLERAIEDQIVAPLTDKLLMGEIKAGMTVTLSEAAELEENDSVPPPLPPQPQAQGLGEATSPQLPFDLNLLRQALDLGQPALDRPLVTPEEQEARNRAEFDRLWQEFRDAMVNRGIELEVDQAVRDVLCSPAMADARDNKTTTGAFIALIEMPLNKQFSEQRLLSGDRVRVWYNKNSIELTHLESDGEGNQ
jgi:ATP-dependent Clp protease ATP-binding subunit ClpC